MSKGDNSVSAEKENVVLFGAEGGEGATRGGEVSISKAGLAAFKEAASDIKEMFSPTPPPRHLRLRPRRRKRSNSHPRKKARLLSDAIDKWNVEQQS
jgi:hypothetical protein